MTEVRLVSAHHRLGCFVFKFIKFVILFMNSPALRFQEYTGINLFDFNSITLLLMWENTI